MDRGDAMTLSGSSSYYIQQRGITGSEDALHGSPALHYSNVQYHSSVSSTSLGSTLPVEPSSAIPPHSNVGAAPSAVPPSETVKRKRGRPRKYGPDGTVSLGLTSSPPTHPGLRAATPTLKRGRGRPLGSGKKQQLASLGEWLSGSAGMGFTPHVITIEIGEDIAAKIVAFSQQGPRAVCILSANGAVSTVTLNQPSSSGGSVTYEGRFEILCLSGSYILGSTGGPRNRTGGLSVSLASPDGRVIGGGVGGMLIAASPVQVIVGSFIWGGSKTKNKKGDGHDIKDSDDQTVDNLFTPTSVVPSHNLPPSPTSIWPGSRTMDMQNTHVDIDLMRGL